MALPAVLLKAKSALKKAKVVNDAKNTVNSVSQSPNLSALASILGFKKQMLVLKIGLIAIGAFIFLALAIFALQSGSRDIELAHALSPSDNQDGGNNGVGGPILLIAGHSYKPYCEKVSNECRGAADSGYAEEEETRALVKQIKTELQNLGVEADIANQLMAPNDANMNTSFFVESTLNTDTFNNIDWSKYKYVLEVHFNASNGSSSGPLLVKNSASYSTDADEGIIKAVTSNLKTTQIKDSIQSLNDINYFTNKNIPITYLETEFYDNKTAMDNFKSNSSQVAKDIAQAIKDAYGQASDTSSVVECAKGALGVPYVWGGTSYTEGMDCSGLVYVCYQRALGVTVGRTTYAELEDPQFERVSSIDQLQPGDLINTYHHVAIYIGNNRIIHEPQTGDVCKESDASWMLNESHVFLHYKG